MVGFTEMYLVEANQVMIKTLNYNISIALHILVLNIIIIYTKIQHIIEYLIFI